MKSIRLNILIFFIITFCFSCEDYYNKRVVFTLQSIIVDKTVIGQGETVNISAVISIQGMVNKNDVKYTWDCVQGEFNDRTKQATIWTAPFNTGEFLIRLTVSFMGHTEEGEIAVKVVRTPAGSWGSLSGNVINQMKDPIQNIIVTTKTGEYDTTDITGFFIIEDIPQGSTGLEFSNVGFKWVTEPLDRINVAGGNHEHFGNIILYESLPPVIDGYNEIPEHQTMISIHHDHSNLFEYFELYLSYFQDGSDSKLSMLVTPSTTNISFKETVDSAYVALKSIPLQGEASDLSSWTKIRFTKVIDPNAEMSYFIYNNFFSASLNWSATGYEEYYKGFRVATKNELSEIVFISPLLSVRTFTYELETKPGMSCDYYVLAITKTDRYNLSQPIDQKITLEVPFMESPSGFKGTFGAISEINIMLRWEPIATNNSWYSGYLIEKKIITDTLEHEWEVLTLIGNSFIESYKDLEVNTANTYRYKIRTMTYPSGLGNPEYSMPDSITVGPF